MKNILKIALIFVLQLNAFGQKVTKNDIELALQTNKSQIQKRNESLDAMFSFFENVWNRNYETQKLYKMNEVDSINKLVAGFNKVLVEKKEDTILNLKSETSIFNELRKNYYILNEYLLFTDIISANEVGDFLLNDNKKNYEGNLEYINDQNKIVENDLFEIEKVTLRIKEFEKLMDKQLVELAALNESNLVLIEKLSTGIKKYEFVFVETPEKETITDFYVVVEEFAEFPGGPAELKKYLANNILYPPTAVEMNIQGTIYVRFVVSDKGSVSNVKITKGINNCPACNREALRVYKEMPAWKPAKNNGKVVNCYFNSKVKFQLN